MVTLRELIEAAKLCILDPNITNYPNTTTAGDQNRLVGWSSSPSNKKDEAL